MKESTDLPLSRREFQILALIAQGHISKQIAAILSISEDTVSNHRCSILKKTKLKSMAAAIVWYTNFETTNSGKPLRL